MLVFARRLFALVAVLTALTASAGSADAQEIKFYVVQSTGLFEITSQSTGGRFKPAPRNEFIYVPGTGVMRVMGTTDRAKRLETVVTQILGAGLADVAVTFQPSGGRQTTIFSGHVPLPLVVPRTVSPSTNVDNVTVSVRQSGRTVTRRLPIGTRP
jgi:hypothetical protein